LAENLLAPLDDSMHATNATLAWHDHKEWINWPMRHIEKWDDGWYKNNKLLQRHFSNNLNVVGK
jgi:hypothetical protein